MVFSLLLSESYEEGAFGANNLTQICDNDILLAVITPNRGTRIRRYLKRPHYHYDRSSYFSRKDIKKETSNPLES